MSGRSVVIGEDGQDSPEAAGAALAAQRNGAAECGAVERSLAKRRDGGKRRYQSPDAGDRAAVEARLLSLDLAERPVRRRLQLRSAAPR